MVYVCFLSDVHFRSRVDPTSQAVSAKGLKHINLVETSYLVSLRSHIALIFVPFTFLLEVFPWVEGIFKAFGFHTPRIYALVTVIWGAKVGGGGQVK